MASESLQSRPLCGALSERLRRNSNRLLLAISVGLALALAGASLQHGLGQRQSHYVLRASGLAGLVRGLAGSKLEFLASLAPGQQAGSCCGGRWAAATAGLLRHWSWVAMALHLGQLLLLQCRCRSARAAAAIGALACVGALGSLSCLVAGLSGCKPMCLACLGLHHGYILYLACRRRKLLEDAQGTPSDAPAGCVCSGPAAGGPPKSPCKTSRFPKLSANKSSASDKTATRSETARRKSAHS